VNAATELPPCFVRLHASPKVLCIQCARPLAPEKAKFHRLRCKTRDLSRFATYDGAWLDRRREILQ
jgi:hypothetical protein